MTLIVQDDSGTVANANSYIDVAYFRAYHADRGNDVTAYSDTLIGQALIRGRDYQDQRFKYVGFRFRGVNDQSTEWPRYNAYGRDDLLIVGVPREVKEAQAEYALRALTAALNPDIERDLTGRQVTSISKEVAGMSKSISFADYLPPSLPEYPAADLKLRQAGLIRSSMSGSLRRG